MTCFCPYVGTSASHRLLPRWRDESDLSKGGWGGDFLNEGGGWLIHLVYLGNDYAAALKAITPMYEWYAANSPKLPTGHGVANHTSVKLRVQTHDSMQKQLLTARSNLHPLVQKRLS